MQNILDFTAVDDCVARWPSGGDAGLTYAGSNPSLRAVECNPAGQVVIDRNKNSSAEYAVQC